MKKILRLVLLIFIIFFLFSGIEFVTECRRMKDVFNNFIALEDPSSGKKCSVVNETILSKYENLHFMDNPSPLWVNVGELHIYSAFWKREIDNSHAIALGIGPGSPLNEAYDCTIWFDYKNIVSSVTGKFTFSSYKWNSSLSMYYFVCRPEENIKGDPSVLVINYNKGGYKQKRHFAIFDKSLTFENLKNRTAICVRPDTVGVGKADIIEFISFHLLIGVTDLVLYGNHIHNDIITKLRQLIGAKNFLKSLSMVPWNFPIEDDPLELKLIEADCMYRTFGLARAAAVLQWDQYLVPNVYKRLLDIINPLEGINQEVDVLSQICCLESYNDKRSESSWPVILKKTRCSNYPFYSYLRIHGNKVDSESTVHLNYSSMISVKTYRSCLNLKKLRTKYDHSSQNFLSGLLSIELQRLWSTGSLF